MKGAAAPSNETYIHRYFFIWMITVYLDFIKRSFGGSGIADSKIVRKMSVVRTCPSDPARHRL
jgi:hypothetical protein